MSSTRWREKGTRTDELRRLLLVAAVSGASVATAGCAVETDPGDDMVGGNGPGASSGGTAGMTVGGSGGQGPGRAPHGCEPDNFWVDSTNLEACVGGFVHRKSTAACPLPNRDESGEGSSSVCNSDADCSEQPNGYCEKVPTAIVGLTNRCLYACETDSDCGSGELCSCEEIQRGPDAPSIIAGRCVAATCTSDADCDDGLLCIAPLRPSCEPARPYGFHCQKPEDECSGDADCGSGYACLRSDEAFACEELGISGNCGRPFLVHGEARTAEQKTLHGAEPSCVAPGCVELSPSERARIATHYVRAALMEHASIAAFARFTLQLLALGAPASLVQQSVAATADEERHTRACFALAARYSQAAMTAGPLDVSGALDDADLLTVVRLVIDEGCAGESIAALEAHAAADLATDASVKQALSEIAGDEARHADLAFRFVAWATGRDARVRGVVLSRLRRLEAEDETAEISSVTAGHSEALVAHGLLDAATRRSVRKTALDSVVIPTLRALAAEPHARADAVRVSS